MKSLSPKHSNLRDSSQDRLPTFKKSLPIHSTNAALIQKLTHYKKKKNRKTNSTYFHSISQQPQFRERKSSFQSINSPNLTLNKQTATIISPKQEILFDQQNKVSDPAASGKNTKLVSSSPRNMIKRSKDKSSMMFDSRSQSKTLRNYEQEHEMIKSSKRNSSRISFGTRFKDMVGKTDQAQFSSTSRPSRIIRGRMNSTGHNFLTKPGLSIEAQLRTSFIDSKMIRDQNIQNQKLKDQKLRNVSYLFEKPNFITLRPPDEKQIQKLFTRVDMDSQTTKMTKNLKDIKKILEINDYPIYSDEIFDVMALMRMTSKKKQELEKKMIEKAENDQLIDDNHKSCQGLKNYHIRECPERGDSRYIFELFEILSKKYRKNNSEFLSIEEYFKAKKNILAFCQREVIEMESKRCKQTGVTLQRLYLENVNFFNDLMDYLKFFIKAMNRKQILDTQGIKKKFRMHIEEQKYENQYLEKMIEGMREENMGYRRKTQIMRNKIYSDYVVIKWLKDDLEHAVDYNGILTTENTKISSIIANLNNTLNEFAPQNSKELTKELSQIQKIHESFNVQKGKLSHRKMVNDEQNRSKMNQTKTAISFKESLGLELIEAAGLDNFETRDIQVQTENQFKCTIGIQNAPQGYRSRKNQTDKQPCQNCASTALKLQASRRSHLVIKDQKKDLEAEVNELNKKIQSLLASQEIMKQRLAIVSQVKITPAQSPKANFGEITFVQENNINLDFNVHNVHNKNNTDSGNRMKRMDSLLIEPNQNSESQIGGNFNTSNSSRAELMLQSFTPNNMMSAASLNFSYDGDESDSESSSDDNTSKRSNANSRDGKGRMRRRSTRRFHMPTSLKTNGIYRSSVTTTFITEAKKRNIQMLKDSKRIFNKVLESHTSDGTVDGKDGSKRNISLKKGGHQKRYSTYRDSTLVKLIFKIYKDYQNKRKSSKVRTQINFSLFIYKFMSLKVSTKKLLVRNYKMVNLFTFLPNPQLLHSILDNMKIPCINLFAKFLGLSGNLSTEYFELYLDVGQQIKKKKS